MSNDEAMRVLRDENKRLCRKVDDLTNAVLAVAASMYFDSEENGNREIAGVMQDCASKIVSVVRSVR